MLKLHMIPEVFGDDPLRSGLYEATVNGQACGVRTCRMSAMPFNTCFIPHQRPLDQTEEAAFVTFSGDGEVRVKVDSKAPFNKVTLRPLVNEIETSIEGNSVEFTLPGPGQYVLELDSEHHALHIFYDPAKEFPEKDNATYSFGPGLHFPGNIELKDNDSVYIDPDAVVYGSIRGINVRNIKIYGGGILDDTCHERIFWNDCVRWAAQCEILLVGCENIEIEDIVMLNSPVWVIGVFGCEKVKIDRVKIVGQWRYNTDGIDIVNCQDVTISNSFIRSFDDGIVLKGLDWAFNGYSDWKWKNGRNVEDIRVSGCVVWCGWGRTLEIGLETDAPEYRNIIFEDCDLIHNSIIAMDIANANGALVHDLTFQDIRVEFQADTQPEILQLSDDHRYEPGDKKQPTILYLSHNRHYQPWETREGVNRDILLEDIRVFSEPGVGKPEIALINTSPEQGQRNHTIRNLTVNGQKIQSLQEIEYRSEGGAEAPVIE